jgi:outer membrane cobalamin receptor
MEESLLTSFSKTSTTLLTSKLVRRPQVLIKNTFFYKDFSFESEYMGKRKDVDALNNSVMAPAYFISHLNYSYKNAFIKIKNIFNTEYEEAYGYGTGGRMITVGIKSNF